MIKAILDPGYQPMAKVVTDYQKRVAEVGGVPMVIAVERNKGYISTYKMNIFEDGTGHDEENYGVAERIVKTLLWLYGGYKVTIAGSEKIYEGLKRIIELYKNKDSVTYVQTEYINKNILEKVIKLLEWA